MLKISLLLVLMFSCGFSQIPNNTWVEIHPTYLPAPNGGMQFPMGWNKLVYDSVDRQIICYDRWYDSIRDGSIYANCAIGLDLATDTAHVIKLTNWRKVGNVSGGYTTEALPENAVDSTPVDRHPYGAFVYVPEKNACYLTNGANQTAPGNHPNDTWRLDLSNAKWHQINTVSPPNKLEDAMAYDSYNRKIVYSSHGNQTWLFNIDSETWSRVYPSNAPTTDIMGHMVAYDSRRHVAMLFGGGPYPNPGQALYALDVAANTYTRKADCPVLARACGFVYCPRFDLFAAVIDSHTYLYRPGTDTWTQLITPQNPHCVYQTMAYDIENDLFVVQGGDWSQAKWWVMRLDEATVAEQGRMVLNTIRLDASPNPFSAATLISISGVKGPYSVSIFDPQGKKAAFFPCASNSIAWNAQALAQGVYIVRLSSEGVVYKKRIIKVK